MGQRPRGASTTFPGSGASAHELPLSDSTGGEQAAGTPACGSPVTVEPRRDSVSCDSSGPSMRAPGAMSGDRKGIVSVAGLLLKEMSTLPARLTENLQRAQRQR